MIRKTKTMISLKGNLRLLNTIFDLRMIYQVMKCMFRTVGFLC